MDAGNGTVSAVELVCCSGRKLKVSVTLNTSGDSTSWPSSLFPAGMVALSVRVCSRPLCRWGSRSAVTVTLNARMRVGWLVVEEEDALMVL